MAKAPAGPNMNALFAELNKVRGAALAVKGAHSYECLIMLGSCMTHREHVMIM